MRHATEFLGDHKKEDPNNEERVLSKIKVAGMEEPDNLEMAELDPAPSEKSEFIQTLF